MNKSIVVFRSKLPKLKEKIEAQITEEMSAQRQVLFLSVCNKKRRAKVFRSVGENFEAAWHSACKQVEQYLDCKEISPDWIKLDLVTDSRRVAFSKVQEEIGAGLYGYYRYGISFDDEFRSGLLEEELNGNALINYKEGTLKFEKINTYLSKYRNTELEQLPQQVVVFDCVSVFMDEQGECYDLHKGGYDHGRRQCARFEKEMAKEIIATGTGFLVNKIDEAGRFQYGIYPIAHKEVSGYNILRHAGAAWSMLCAYRITHEEVLLKKAKQAIDFLREEMVYVERKGEILAYLLERKAGEIKLGGNAIAILLLTEYMDITEDTSYEGIATALGQGILSMYHPDTGAFTHVLHSADFSVKDEMRTVFYDGEAVFALLRIYGRTKESKWLDASVGAVERFIREDYIKYKDHWLAYAMNELTKYVPEEKYFAFALKNVTVNLKKIHNQKTSYHTFMELLCVTFEMYQRMCEEGLAAECLEKFDEKALVNTIFHRADFMLNSYAYPEFVMYFRYPEELLGATFIRQDRFRIRIDDIQHFCGGYYLMYKHYDEMVKIVER